MAHLACVALGSFLITATAHLFFKLVKRITPDVYVFSCSTLNVCNVYYFATEYWILNHLNHLNTLGCWELTDTCKDLKISIASFKETVAPAVSPFSI